MLLALDAGNTNITIGAFEDRNLIGRWRLRTVLDQTADEWGVLLRNLFSLSDAGPWHGGRGHHCQRGAAAGFQPGADGGEVLPQEAMFVTPDTDTGLKIGYENPSEVGRRPHRQQRGGLQ